MSYQSLFYGTLFLPAVFVLYTLTKQAYRKYVLLGASWLFYFLAMHRVTWVLVATCVGVYGAALWIDRASGRQRTMRLACAIALLAGALIRVKYAGWIADGIGMLAGHQFSVRALVVPLGISYYTLEAIGYLCEVYWQHQAADRDFVRVALFLSFFPQIMEGPIARYQDSAASLCAGQPITGQSLRNGCLRMLWGFFKKMAGADRLSLLVTVIFSQPHRFHGWAALLGSAAYVAQLYLEFSGMIDVTMGTAEVLQIHLPENFRQPFFSRSASEFWRRWHITLGTWLKTYVFFPVSTSHLVVNGNRQARKKYGRQTAKVWTSFLALTPVWLFNGFWHGAKWHYIFYGLYYLVILMLEVILEPAKKRFYSRTGFSPDRGLFSILRWLRTLAIIVAGEVIFRADTVTTAFTMIGNVFRGPSHVHALLAASHLDFSDGFVVVLCLILVTVVDVCREKGVHLFAWFDRQPTAVRWALSYSLIFALICFGAYGAGYRKVDMIYAKF